ncbi:MAG: thioredoxin domain-containing protein [Kofleriaceae bacterium]|nr:thioredoxin domain-containing protein [Kofleriaceae bacterium]
MRRAVLLGVLLTATLAHADKLGFDPAAIYKVPRGASPTEGPAQAPITIVTWSDFACGHCYRVQPTLDALNKLYPEQIRWVHRTMPLDEDDTTAAEAALAAAAQGRFRPMSDRLYAMGGRVDRAAVELIARELGLDMVRFRADLDARTYRAQIATDLAEARKLGVTGTPTFFVNGRPINGSQPLKIFADVLDEELARAATTPGDYDALVGAGKLGADVAGGDPDHASTELDLSDSYRVGLGLPGHQDGPDDALVTIVVWSDFQCPFCAKEAPVLRQLREKYKQDVRVVFRHLAMSFHRRASIASEAAIAAAMQGKFWAFHDQMFDNFGNLERADLERYAQNAGLDMTAFRAALDDRRYRDLVVAEGASAQALGVDGTPTMFVQGRPVIGAKDFATMDALVGSMVERARAISASIPRGDLYALMMVEAKGSERADPSRIPTPAGIRIALRTNERIRAAISACRTRDRGRAASLASDLAGPERARLVHVCKAAGVDL